MSETNLFDLSGRIVIVAGGGGLIGNAVCDEIDARGGTVIVADRNTANGEKLANELENGSFEEIDITDPDSVKGLYDSVEEKFGGIDALVNVSYPRNENYGRPLEDVRFEDWKENLNLHLGGYFLMAREAATRMGAGGSIVNFGSIYGIQAPDFSVYDGTDIVSPVEYAAIKSGILNMTRYLASYLGPEGIRVNAISPGGVFDNQDERFVDNYRSDVPLGRMAEPEDISGAAVFLVSDASSYVTGHNLVVDGGWTIQ